MPINGLGGQLGFLVSNPPQPKTFHLSFHSKLCHRHHIFECKFKWILRAKGRVFRAQISEATIEEREKNDVSGPIVKHDNHSQVDQELFPERYKMILATSLAFVICNMDKVNMSVAIIPMSHQFGWDATTAGLVQSSFFWGYAVSQLPGGWLAKQFTGKNVLCIGVLVWSLATAAIPYASAALPGILACRLLVGLGEGVSPSAATDLVARTIPIEERSRAVSLVFGGLNVGSILGLLIAPGCIEKYGWESVFYIFGSIGVLWCLGFRFADKNGGFDFFNQEREAALKSDDMDQKQRQNTTKKASENKIPWKGMSRTPAVWAMTYAHFCGNWGHYTLLSWLPTYLSDALKFNLTDAALVSIFPPLASVLVSSIAAPFADSLISSGVEITIVRKLCQSVAFISPSICLTIAALDINISPTVTILILTSGIGLSSFGLSGLYCSHQDISPKYAGVLLGITSTAGALPGILGIALCGYIYDQSHSWGLALFAPSIFFYVSGTIIWNLFANCEPQSFEES